LPGVCHAMDHWHVGMCDSAEKLKAG
jgi:hypothetical protein